MIEWVYHSPANVLHFIIITTSVTWMKDGQPLEATTKYVQTGDGKKRFKLEIPNLTATDIGQYSVKVAGKQLETQASFSLNVTVSELWEDVLTPMD